MAVLWVSVSAFAYDFEADGIYYNITSPSNLEVEVTYDNNSVMTTLGSVKVSYYSSGACDCHYYSGEYYRHKCTYSINSTYSGDIVIPETVNYANKTYTVTAIGNDAFGAWGEDGCNYYAPGYKFDDACEGSAITSVKIPKTVRIIKAHAFSCCKSLGIVTFAEGLEIIEANAFMDCPITQLNLPQSLSVLAAKAFFNCIDLEEIHLSGETPKSFGAYCFYNCDALRELNLSNGQLESLGENCFASCSNLAKAIVGSSVRTMPASSFSDCPKLSELFMLPVQKPEGFGMPSGCHAHLEVYVPSSAAYGFGVDYLTFESNTFDYTGLPHNIVWANTLKAYKCAIAETDCLTDADAGNHTKMLRAIYSDGIDFTVDIPYDYVINKAPLSLTVNDVERAYGDQNPQFTCSMSGLVNGETEEEQFPKLTFECEATRMSRPGNYRILAALENPNYDITYKYGTLTVKKAPLSLTVENAEKTYGSPNPEFKYSVSGLKNGETVPQWEKEPVLTSEATATSGVGQYPITAAGGTTANYEIAQSAPGVLTVNSKELTVKADDYERLYNESNPDFTISYEGFVDGDSEESLSEKPTTDCDAVKSSDAGSYPITVSGGKADNYSLTYQNGTLTINPLTIGFAKTNYTVTYNDMSISNNEDYFNFTPEVTGEYDEKDFRMTLWFLDKDNNYNGHVVATIPDGEFAGNYVENSLTERTWGGKYIFNLVKTSTNPNVVANPDRAYVTVRRASTNLKWLSDEPLVLKSGDRVELGVSYDADFWCSFKTDFDKELISVTSENATEKDAKWYVTGLKEGETTLKFSITCRKNNLGSYDFDDSETITKRIIVEPSAGISEVAEGNGIAVYAENGDLYISKPEASVARVYTLQGVKIAETADEVIDNLAKGLYIVVVDNRSFKISLR